MRSRIPVPGQACQHIKLHHTKLKFKLKCLQMLELRSTAVTMNGIGCFTPLRLSRLSAGQIECLSQLPSIALLSRCLCSLFVAELKAARQQKCNACSIAALYSWTGPARPRWIAERVGVESPRHSVCVTGRVEVC